MEIRNAKLMGGIGAILTVLAFIPEVGWLFAITGLVLVLLSIKELSAAVNNKKIFDNYLVAFILNIVGSIVAVIAGVATFLGVFGLRGLSGVAMMRGNIINRERFFGNFSGGFFGAGIIAIIIVALAALAVVIIASYFTKLSFEGISKGTNVEYFKTSGMLIFIGSILLVVFGVGAIVMFVGLILEIVGFFSLPDKLERPITDNNLPSGSASVSQ
ncbi:MAG: DUF996 domain-containing protein [Caldisericaceae bacterium]